MGNGLAGYMAIAKQNSFGTAVTSYIYIEPITESFGTAVEQLILEGLHNGFNEGETVEGMESVEGDFSMNIHPTKTGHVFQAVCGQATSTLVTSDGGFEDYLHEFFPLNNTDFDQFSSLPPYTMQVFRDTVESYQYTDTVFPNISIEIEAGTVPTLTVNGLSRTTSLMTATGPSFETGTPFAWNVVSFSIGDVGIIDFENVSVSFDQGLEAVGLLNATKRAALFQRSSFQQPKVSGAINFATNSEYLRFKAQGDSRMLMTFNSMTNSGATMTIDLPRMRYTSYAANLGGPGRISADFEGDAKLSAASGYAIRFTLQNTQVSY